MSFFTGTNTELLFINATDYTAVASTSSEASLLAGVNEQPIFQPAFWLNPAALRRAFRLVGRGVFSTTGTPTMIFTFRLGTTAGATYLSGTQIGASAAITTASGVTSKFFELEMDVNVRTPGIGTGNTTLVTSGRVASYSGFASPFHYPIEATTPDTATWTATIDGSLTQYLNLSLSWSASSASNSAVLKVLKVYGEN